MALVSVFIFGSGDKEVSSPSLKLKLKLLAPDFCRSFLVGLDRTSGEEMATKLGLELELELVIGTVSSRMPTLLSLGDVTVRIRLCGARSLLVFGACDRDLDLDLDLERDRDFEYRLLRRLLDLDLDLLVALCLGSLRALDLDLDLDRDVDDEE